MTCWQVVRPMSSGCSYRYTPPVNIRLTPMGATRVTWGHPAQQTPPHPGQGPCCAATGLWLPSTTASQPRTPTPSGKAVKRTSVPMLAHIYADYINGFSSGWVRLYAAWPTIQGCCSTCASGRRSRGTLASSCARCGGQSNFSPYTGIERPIAMHLCCLATLQGYSHRCTLPPQKLASSCDEAAPAKQT